MYKSLTVSEYTESDREVRRMVISPWARYHIQWLIISLYFHLEKKADLPDLSAAMLNKLRHLTMVSLATKTKVKDQDNDAVLQLQNEHMY